MVVGGSGNVCDGRWWQWWMVAGVVVGEGGEDDDDGWWRMWLVFRFGIIKHLFSTHKGLYNEIG